MFTLSVRGNIYHISWLVHYILLWVHRESSAKKATSNQNMYIAKITHPNATMTSFLCKLW